MYEFNRAGAERWRGPVDRTLAEYRDKTRAIAARLTAAEPPRREPVRHDDADDNDLVESWMADPRGPAEPVPDEGQGLAFAAVDRLERGELSWDDVLFGQSGDREVVALRDFLDERASEFRAAREASG